MELRRKTDLQCANTFRGGILTDLGSYPPHGIGSLKNREGDTKSCQRLVQAHPSKEVNLRFILRKCYAGIIGQIPKCRQTQRAVEVSVKVGILLGHGAESSLFITARPVTSL